MIKFVLEIWIAIENEKLPWLYDKPSSTKFKSAFQILSSRRWDIYNFPRRRIGWEKYINLRRNQIVRDYKCLSKHGSGSRAHMIISVKSRIGRDRDVVWSFSFQPALIFGRWGKPGEVSGGGRWRTVCKNSIRPCRWIMNGSLLMSGYHTFEGFIR